jgi:hypothetical protein
MTKRHLLPIATLALLAACGEAPTAQTETPTTPSFEQGGNYGGSGNVVESPTTSFDGGNYGGSGNATTGTDSTTAGGGDATRGGNYFGSGN